MVWHCVTLIWQCIDFFNAFTIYEFLFMIYEQSTSASTSDGQYASWNTTTQISVKQTPRKISIGKIRFFMQDCAWLAM